MIIDHVIHGAGPKRVLVMHDWNGDRRNYDPALPYLDGTTFTYAFVDLRGYGGSKHIAGEHSVAEIAADCLAVADALGWDQFHVVGHSMTGMATQRLALDAPGRILSAVAVCPVSAAGMAMDEQTRAFFQSTTTDQEAFRALITMVSGPLSGGWADAKLRWNRQVASPEVRVEYLAMFAETNFAESVQGLETPFLVMVGEHDAEGLDAAAMEKTYLAWHPNAELTVVPNCGHYPMQECPPYFVSSLESFLGKQAR